MRERLGARAAKLKASGLEQSAPKRSAHVVGAAKPREGVQAIKKLAAQLSLPGGGEGEGDKLLCYSFRDTGECRVGAKCRFSYDAGAHDATKNFLAACAVMYDAGGAGCSSEGLALAVAMQAVQMGRAVDLTALTAITKALGAGTPHPTLVKHSFCGKL